MEEGVGVKGGPPPLLDVVRAMMDLVGEWSDFIESTALIIEYLILEAL